MYIGLPWDQSRVVSDLFPYCHGIFQQPVLRWDRCYILQCLNNTYCQVFLYADVPFHRRLCWVFCFFSRRLATNAVDTCTYKRRQHKHEAQLFQSLRYNCTTIQNASCFIDEPAILFKCDFWLRLNGYFWNECHGKLFFQRQSADSV